MKLLNEKRSDTPLHLAVRAGNLELALEMIANNISDDKMESKKLLSNMNESDETALYVAAELGNAELVKEMIKYCDLETASIKARNGCDAFLIGSKEGHLEVLKVLMEAFLELSMTLDHSSTTALHMAASQGHIEVVNFLLESNSHLANIAKSNGKTALHSSSRHGHLEVVKALLKKEPKLALRMDKKGQTALHMAVKGQSVDVVHELIASNSDLINVFDAKGNTALHIATRKGRLQIVQALLSHKGIIDTKCVNKSGESSLDTAIKTSKSEIALILQEHGVQKAKPMKPPPLTNTGRELKQTVSDITVEVEDNHVHTPVPRRRVKGISKRFNKVQAEGLNNAINSTTVVAVLIATVAFAAIFTVPGQYVDDPKNIPQHLTLGEANIAPSPAFPVFLIFDALALFISLAVVVVQTSVVVVERKAKKQMMAIINKLMWLACTFISVSFLALSYIVVGKDRWLLAVVVTVIGTVFMATTLGTLCYWVIIHRIKASNTRSIRRSARSSMSVSWSVSAMSDSENDDNTNLYAI